jgi:hypothetical protein
VCARILATGPRQQGISDQNFEVRRNLEFEAIYGDKLVDVLVVLVMLEMMN